MSFTTQISLSASSTFTLKNTSEKTIGSKKEKEARKQFLPMTTFEEERFIQNPERANFDTLLTALLGKSSSKEVNTLLKTMAQNEKGLLYLDPKCMANIKGLTRTKLLCLLAANELGRRQHTYKWYKNQGVNLFHLAKHLKSKLIGLDKEHFYLYSFNRSLGFIHEHLMSSGGGDAVQVYFRDIVKTLLNDRASKTIIAHNHPDQTAKPSLPDLQCMHRLKKVLQEMDIELIDQYIVGLDGVYSCKMANFIE